MVIPKVWGSMDPYQEANPSLHGMKSIQRQRNGHDDHSPGLRPYSPFILTPARISCMLMPKVVEVMKLDTNLSFGDFGSIARRKYCSKLLFRGGLAMIISEMEFEAFMRRFVIEVAFRLNISAPEFMDEKTLLLAIEQQDQTALQVLAAFRSSYGEWYSKSHELETAALKESDLTGIRMDLMRLMKARDVTREAMIRYLDFHYPRSISRIAV